MDSDRSAATSLPPIPGGNRERIGKWADFVYLRIGGVTHIKPHIEDSTTTAYPTVLCGRSPRFLDAWRGTGSQTEYDQARRMPLCVRCTARARDRNA
jgi:hypothetical protein